MLEEWNMIMSTGEMIQEKAEAFRGKYFPVHHKWHMD